MIKLTKEQVAEIVCRLDSGGSCGRIAADYDVTAHCINSIDRGRTWSWFTGRHRDTEKPKPRGSAHSRVKIDEMQAVAIYDILESGASGPQVSTALGIPLSIVTAIQQGRSWTWLTGIKGGK